MYLVHYGRELGVLVVHVVDQVYGVVEVLHVLCVHLEEGREASDDVADPLELGRHVPLLHPLTELEREFEGKIIPGATQRGSLVMALCTLQVNSAKLVKGE